MNNKQTMSWVLFWTFWGIFVLSCLGVLGMLFFNFGSVREEERSLLINAFLIETAVAIGALFYSLFQLRGSSKTDASTADRSENMHQSSERLSGVDSKENTTKQARKFASEISDKAVVFDIGKGFTLGDGINGLKVKILKCHSNIKHKIEPVYVLEFSLLNDIEQEIQKLESMVKNHPEKEHELYEKTKFRLEIIEKHNEAQRVIDLLFFNTHFRNSMEHSGYLFNENMEANCIAGLIDIQNYTAMFGQENTWFLINKNKTDVYTTISLSDEEIKYMETGYYEDDELSTSRRQGVDSYQAYSILSFSPTIFGKRALPNLLLCISRLNKKELISEQYRSLCDVKSWYFSKSHPSKISVYKK